MLFHSIKTQIHILLKRKLIWITFFVVLACVLIHYWSQINLYVGQDVIYMIHPAKLSLLSAVSSGRSGMRELFFQLYPMLVILPAGFSLMQDSQSGEILFLYSRVGGKNYYAGKMIATFVVTAFIFMIPLWIELGMNFIVYPRKAIGDINGGTYWESRLLREANNLYGGLEAGYPYIATMVGIGVLGIVSGILATFTVAISSFGVKFKVLLFLPIYLILYLLAQLNGKIPNITFSTVYKNYLQLFDGEEKSAVWFIGIVLGIAVLSIIIMWRKGRKLPV